MHLGVNIDHVATLRQARLAKEPDPLMAAPFAVLGGADGITVHLREDRRHIGDRDLRLLREVIPVELNLEMAATAEMLNIALKVRPDMVTIVPERRQELTTEGGLDIRVMRKKLRYAATRLKDAGIPVSLFINPDAGAVEIAKKIGVDMVEVHTGMYANSQGKQSEDELKKIINAIDAAIEHGLFANAGHGLDYQNVRRVAEIKGVRGLYIGHSIISKAVFVGLERAVREMKEIISRAQA